MDHPTFFVHKDEKDEIKFWLEALKTPGLDEETVDLINKNLKNELRAFANPRIIVPELYEVSEDE